MTSAERTQVRPAYSVLYSFKRGNDGGDPHAGLINVEGTLYGTTEYGGGPCHARCFGGTVFAITTSGAETVLHSFKDGSGDGKDPRAGLINVNGTLYGTTIHGGGASCYCGTVFKVTLSGQETVLYSFAGEPDGAGPDAADLLSVNGTLYGITYYGGSRFCLRYGDPHGCGTVFKITTSGKETVLHSFGRWGDGAHPYAGLINVNGTLYGTTEFGGSGSCGSYANSGCGTVFTIKTSGAETVLYSFKGGSGDGEYPTQAALVDVNGTLYGTNKGGGTNNWGTIFSITTSGKESVLHSFGSSSDGVLPHGGLLDVNGALYGTTSNGGSGSCLRYGYAHGCGTVFQTTTSGKETVLHSFGGSGDGEYPYAGLINVNGTLYGTTTHGGAKDVGTVFSLKP
jgi:uncharacterized repeat protein (TIGR03803 family)